jgi:hypothetical protein
VVWSRTTRRCRSSNGKIVNSKDDRSHRLAVVLHASAHVLGLRLSIDMLDDLMVQILNGDTSDLYETEFGYLLRWTSNRSRLQLLSLKAGLVHATADHFLP